MLASYTTTSFPVLDLDMCTLHSCSHSMLYVATGIYTGTQSYDMQTLSCRQCMMLGTASVTIKCTIIIIVGLHFISQNM